MHHGRLSLACLPWLCFNPLAAAQPHLTLSADRASAGVGESITITCSVADAPAFACWGATILLPANGLATTGQAAGAVEVFVRDSRGDLRPGARLGGYAFANHAAGTYVLGRVTVVGIASGTYTVQAPSFSDGLPFGGILLPKGSGQEVIPGPASLSLTITGGSPRRDLVMWVPLGYEWDLVSPDGTVGRPQDGVQTITIAPWQDALLAPVRLPLACQ